MEPIINPWLIYFAGISKNMQFVCVLLAFACGIIVIARLMEEEKVDKIVIIFGIFLMFFGVTATLIPSKETIYTIAVMDQLTSDNIDQLGKTSENVIDYIVDKVDQIVNDSDDKKR